jgi:plasmid stability protein
MPRTTLDLDSTVLTDLRRRARSQGKSMGQVASEVLAAGLHDEIAIEQPPLRWAHKDLGLKVDLEDKDAVWRILDAGEFGGRER